LDKGEIETNNEEICFNSQKKEPIEIETNFDFILNEKNNLPFVYNETKIIIMPKDPDTIFMYWDISNNTISDLKQRNIDLAVVIRVRNVDGCNYCYIHPTENSRDWYFNLKYTNLKKTNLIAELGVYDNDGNFLILATSNIINMPTNIYSRKDLDYWNRILNNKNAFLSNVNSMEFFVKK